MVTGHGAAQHSSARGSCNGARQKGTCCNGINMEKLRYMAGIETEVNKTRSAVEGDVLSCNKIIFDSAGAGTGTCREFLILYRYRYIFF